MAIEDFDQVTIAPAKLRPFSKFIMSIGELPTSYLDSLSYAEQVTWFCDYLQNNVIPALNNNAEALEEVQGLMTQLQEYVDNYFTNLDVQEEINNKLDEMAEDGSLTNIIKNYVDPIQEAFENQINDTVDSQTQRIQTNENNISTLSSRMDTFTNLPNGSTAGDAELQDIRVDVFGHTYSSAGASVRGQESQNYDVTFGMLENILEPITLTANDWQYGDVDSTNGNVINIQTRVRTKNAYKVSKGSIIKLSTYTNRYFKVNYFKSAIVGQSNWDNQGTSNLQNTYIVPRDGYICISILAPSSETISTTQTLSDLFTGILYVIKPDIQKSFTMANVPNFLTPILCNNPINFNTTTKILTFPSSCKAYHWKYGTSLNGATDINLANLTYDFSGKQAAVLWYDTINNELVSTNYYEIQINNVMLNNSDYAMLCVIFVAANQITINAPYSINGYKYGIDIANITNLNVKEINHVAQFYADKLPNYWLYDPTNYTNYLEDKIKNVELKGLYNTVFITDTHYNGNAKHSFDLIGVIKDRLNIDNIVFGGDLIGQEDTKEIAKYKLIEHMSAATNRFGNSFKFVFGNHDLNVANLPGTATNEEVEAHALTYEQIYNYCILPFNSDVTFESTELTGEEYYRNKLHYYYDNDLYKIRTIVLDSGTIHDLLGDGGTPGRLRFQYNWLAEVLSNTPANYNVCVFVHEVYGSYENNAGVITAYGTWLSQILNAAKNKTTVSFTDYAGTTYSYNFTNINTINIVGVFSGHIHIDYMTTVNTIPFIVTTKDTLGAIPDWGSVPMEAGTITEQAFDIISIDTTNRVCYLTRIGAGQNRQFNY